MIDSQLDHFSIENYLACNLITSLIWIIEVSLVILTHVRLANEIEWKHRWSTHVEAIFAAYFLVDSVCNILQKHRGSDFSDRMMFIDVFINLIAYVFESHMRLNKSDEVGNGLRLLTMSKQFKTHSK